MIIRIKSDVTAENLEATILDKARKFVAERIQSKLRMQATLSALGPRQTRKPPLSLGELVAAMDPESVVVCANEVRMLALAKRARR